MPPSRPVFEVGLLFLRLGATAFGGPAAAIAMMRDEVVERRRWLDEQQFLDLLGVTNLSPGPTASKMAMYLGHRRAGLLGLFVGGICFLLPAMLIMLGLAGVYVAYGTTPTAAWLLYGIKPVIVPLIVLALWQLGRSAVKNITTALIGIAVMGLYFTTIINLVLLLVGGGICTLVIQNAARLKRAGQRVVWLPWSLFGAGVVTVSNGANFSLERLFLLFLKVGAVMYGSGYVLFAFLQSDLVENYGWLTAQQLIDAIAAGQMTPGPLSTSATFIGYVLGGVPGALLATVGIYLPAFIIVAISTPLVPRLRHSSWASSLLDGINAAALGLMAAVTWELAQAAFPDMFAVLVGLVAAGLLLGTNINSMGLVMFGAAMGWLRTLS